MTIDYSKWDHIDDSDSDSDDHQHASKPRVTRLDQPGSVSWSKDGSVSIGHGQTPSKNNTSSSTKSPTKPSATASEERHIEFVASSKKTKNTKNSFNDQLETLDRNGGIFRDEKTNHIICWSQNRSEVIVTIPFESESCPSKSISVQVIPSSFSSFNTNDLAKNNPILPYSNRHCAVGGSGTHDTAIKPLDKGMLIVSYSQKNYAKPNFFLKGILPHFIHGTQEGQEEENHQVEWEIINDGRYGNSETIIEYLSTKSETKSAPTNYTSIKMIQITLRKAVPMYGMYLWWEQVLSHCPKINVSEIQDRKNSNIKQSQRNETELSKKRSNSISSVWEEAHAMFREKINNQDSQSPKPFFEIMD